MLKLLALALVSAALCACASVPQNISFDASSNRGLIIVEATPTRRGVPLPEFSLNIAQYSDTEHRLTANSFDGWAGVNSATPSADGRYWIVARAEPGRYVITGLTHQSFWVSCFNTQTRAFNVRAGEVVFLGRIDPLPALITMATTLPPSTSTHVFAMDQRITFTGASEIPDWQPAVDAYVRSAFPNVTAPVVAGASDAVAFNTGWDLTRSRRVCGGYYAPSGAAETPAN